MKFYEYGITRGASADEWGFDLRRVVGKEVPESLYPLVKQVSYDFVGNRISGRCVNGAENSTDLDSEATTPCLEGTVDLGPTLSFTLKDTRTNTTTSLLASNKEWHFPDDAPSVRLHRVPSNYSSNRGDVALTTIVTKPGECNLLKVCLGPGMESGVEMIAPIGILLLKMDDYGVLCTEKGTSYSSLG